MDDHEAEASDPATEYAAILDGFWVRAMEGLVGQGVLWSDAAVAMFRIAALQLEASCGAEAGERSAAAVRDYMGARRKAAAGSVDDAAASRH